MLFSLKYFAQASLSGVSATASCFLLPMTQMPPQNFLHMESNKGSQALAMPGSSTAAVSPSWRGEEKLARQRITAPSA